MLTDLKTGDKIRYIAIVKLFKAGSTATGGVFARGVLQDKSGSLNFICFDRSTTEFFKDMSCPGPAVIHGTVQFDKFANDGTLQILIECAEPIAESDDIAHLLPVTPKSMTEYKSLLTSLIADVHKPHLQQLLQAIFQGKMYDCFVKNPAAMKFHHAYIGGLLEHSVDVAVLAKAMAGAVQHTDLDIVITGALLHDIGKIREISPSLGFEYTETGRMLGHLALGALIVERVIRDIADFPENDAVDLLHIILSHHGTMDKGSPVVNATPESFIVHYADELNAALSQFSGGEPNQVSWEYNKMLSRQIRKKS